MKAPHDPSTLFGAVATAFARDASVEQPAPSRGAFGSTSLRYEGRIFAMLVRGAFVVKLTKARVEELVASGRGKPFRGSQGRAMREWVSIEGVEKAVWLRLAREAHAFARAGSSNRSSTSDR